MYLIDFLWSTVTTIVSIASLSSPPDRGFGHDSVQIPLQFPANEAHKASVTAAAADAGPTFSVPGADSSFECQYPKMVGFEPCSTPQNRGCWLYRKSDNKTYDINTNYEDDMPIGVDRYVTLNLKKGWWAADGINFTDAQLFNHTYPGPWIQACWGDRVIVNVTNDPTNFNGTSVHWHGIRQLNTTHMDGVNGVTQCPIAPSDYFVYNWTARQYGSAWYHSHYSVQYADGALGPLTLHGPTSAPFDEAINPPLLVTDWGHKSAFVAAAVGDQYKPSILLNGKGNVTRFNPKWQPDAGIVPSPPLSINFTQTPPGQSPKKYLFRIINTSFDTTFVVSIDNHLMQIVTADFVPIHPYPSTSVFVGIGQRHNVIVEAKPMVNGSTGSLDPNGNYWIRTEVASCFGQPPGYKGYDQNGIIRYNPASNAEPISTKWTNIPTRCSDEDYANLNPILNWTVPKPPANGKPAGEGFKLGYGSDPLPYPLAMYSLDLKTSTKSTPLRVDYSKPVFLNLDFNGTWNESWRIVPEDWKATDWVYLVIESDGDHPMHLHGHDFAILEQAYNKQFNASNLSGLKLNNPPRRDVVLMPTAGYVVIAFKTDNPGPWLVHCHIAAHISQGLGMTIMERQGAAFGIWPNNDSAIVEAKRVCKNWDGWYNNHDNWAKNPDCKEKNPALCFQDDSGV